MNKVTFPLVLQMKRPQVADLQDALVLLGFTIADAETTNQRYGATTRAAVMQFQTAQKLPATGDVDEATANAINGVLADKGAFDPMPGGDPPTPKPPPEASFFTVDGEVVQPDGTPLADRIVRAFDRALCNWRPLGDARTDDLGRYLISYDAAQLKSWGKSRADLKVEVYDPTGNTLLASSPIILQAIPQETVNFAIGDQIYRGPDEYTRANQALAPFLQSRDDLSCIEVADVMILARQAKLANSIVAYYVKAQRWAAELDAPAALFYGLLRRNQPTRLDALFARSLSALWRELEAAKAQNIIKLPLNSALRTLLAKIQQTYLAQASHPYNQLLQTTLLSADQKSVFTQKLTAGDATGDAFWQSLVSDAGLSTAKVSDLKNTFELQTFTADNTSLTIRLRDTMKVRLPREVAAYSVADWQDNVLSAAEVEIPEEILPGAPDPERRAAYAQMLYRSAELRYPTPSLMGQMARDPAWAGNTVMVFFKAYPDFEFRDERTLNFLQSHPEALNLFPDPEAGRADLLRLEQLFQLTPTEEKLPVIQPLWQSGLRSAPQIAFLGRRNAQTKAGGLDRKIVSGIYRKAVHVTAVALNVYLKYHPRLNGLSLAALHMPQLSTNLALARAATALPEWDQLFGSPDACDCSHCESALSPAAYLVDTMAFLDRAVGSTGNHTALDELLERRPDLGTLQLTCENTETELPQIDLVIGILEAIVASADGKTLPADAIGATTLDSEQLAAQPEYMEPAAYEILRGAVYPFDRLPFDLWAEEGRRYLRQMGIARDELMRWMPPKPGVRELEIATETLGMTSKEREIIRKPNTKADELASYWGVDLANGTLRAQLGKVDTLLKQAHIDYDTLLRLLNTRYLNPDRTITVGFGATPCSLDGALLMGAGGTALADLALRSFLDRLHRFMRLQRRLGCTEYELDMIVTALDIADFNDENVPAKLADLKTLHDDLGLSVTELCSWWGKLDSYAFEDELLSQYEAIFLNPLLFPDTHSGTGPDLRNKVFALTADRTDLAVTISTDASLSHWLALSDGATPPAYTLDSDYAAYIQSATRLTSADLLLLAGNTLPKDTTSGHIALNLKNLSLLYRVGSFIRALKISVTDFLRLTQIIGISPLSDPGVRMSPSNSLSFHEIFLEIDSSKWSIEQLAYLLLHDADAAALLTPTTADMDAWLTTMSASFLGIVDVVTARDNADLTAAVTQSLGSTLGLDFTVFDALFIHRTTLWDDLLGHLIVQANAGATGLPVPGEAFHTVFERLSQFAMVWNGLKLDVTHLAFVLDQGPGIGWTDIAAFPLEERSSANFDGWRRLVAAADLQVSLFTVDQSLFGLLEAAQAASNDLPDFVPDDFLALISVWSAWPLTDLTYLTGANGFNFSLPAAMQDEQAFVALSKAFDQFRRAGVSAEQAHPWTIAELGYAETQSIKQALSLSYPSDRWLDVLATIQDALRLLKRDALLGYLLHTLGFEDSNEFYDHYLIDPEQAACARTSRIVEAHAAVQIFAQRILFNLEPFSFAQEDAEAWAWRKRYRVWEAARKVFLYPENWLYPEVRDNKSVFFQELEDGLLQADVNVDTAERLFSEYLYKLDQVSRLEIMGMYQDQRDDGTSTLHVFGRTKDIPQQYFYRRWEDQSRWTPWERVDLDIQGDHLIPIVYNGRLFLFWPDFKLTPIEPDVAEVDDEISALQDSIQKYKDAIDENQTRLDNAPSNDPAIPIYQGLIDLYKALKKDLADQKKDKIAEKDDIIAATPANTVEIGISWSTYVGGRWSSKHVGTESPNPLDTNFLPKDFYFTGWIHSSNRLYLAVRGERIAETESQPFEVGTPVLETDANFPPPTTVEKIDIGYFYFDDCQSQLLFVPDANLSASPGSLGGLNLPSIPALRTVGEGGAGGFTATQQVFAPQGAVHVTDSIQSFDSRKLTGTELSFEIGADAAPETRLLLATADTANARMRYAHQFGCAGSELSPFFYADDKHTYFVQPLPDALILPGLDFASSIDTTTQLSSTRSIASLGTQAWSNSTHFQDTNTSQIIDHSFDKSPVGSLNSQSSALGTILDADPAPSIISSEPMQFQEFRYRFTRFYHPYTCLYLKQLSRYGVDGLLNPLQQDADEPEDPDSLNLYRQATPLESFSFKDTYAPNLDWITNNFDFDELDEKIDFNQFSSDGPYNWEVFFHIPLLIATRLMQNQRYDDARKWFHYIFDPTCTDGKGSERFWKIKPFHQDQLGGATQTLEELLQLGNPDFERQVQEWELNPFQPYVVARLRTTAFMQATVMRYLDCLIGEADMLFTRFTREDINEATQLYLLAADILGDRPTLLPAQEAALLAPNLLLGRFKLILGTGLPFDPLDQLASLIPTSLSGLPSSRSGLPALAGSKAINQSTSSLFPTGATAISAQGGTGAFDTLLLFCLPFNDLLYGYWDTVADRLFKIRHCMNIEGQLRQLPLFAPPIDPALLVRASAAGLDIASILSGLYAPLPNYHFSFMLQKALEICGEVRNLGSALLLSLEKKDGENLGVLRQSHETSLLQALRNIKNKQIEEATSNIDSLTKSKELAEVRAAYYSGLLSNGLIPNETLHLESVQSAQLLRSVGQAYDLTASIQALIPDAAAGAPTCMCASFGGSNLGSALRAYSGFYTFLADIQSTIGTLASIRGGYDRRQHDWTLQNDLANKEIEQLDKQILAAEIRQQIAEADLENHDKQIAQAEEVEEFLKMKFTNQQLYSWMVSKVSSLYFQAYQMALQLARQAEQTFKHELGPDEADLKPFITSLYWDSLKKGLTSGEQLHNDLRRMEQAYLEANRRELEITKHVSLFQLDSTALLTLRETGACDIYIPEVLFDMDFAGHYFRRIKAVRLTIPCVVGPYTNVSATLTLTGSWTRRNTNLADTDQPLQDSTILPQTAIATSNANQDGGVFELNFNDPRYLPFEGAGAVSSWRLELPAAIRMFDYDTIADVILHLSYSARDGSAALQEDGVTSFKQAVNNGLTSSLNDLKALLNQSNVTLSRLFSLRQEFPTEWNRLLFSDDDQSQITTLNLTKRHFPKYLDYLWNDTSVHSIALNIESVSIFLNPAKDNSVTAQDIEFTVNEATAVESVPPGLIQFNTMSGFTGTVITNATGVDYTLSIGNGQLLPENWQDLYILIDYRVDVGGQIH